MTDLDPNSDDDWNSLVEIGAYTSLDRAYEHALVALALDIPCWISDAVETGHYSLHVEPEKAEHILSELDAYESERPAPPSKQLTNQEVFQYDSGWALYFFWAAILMAVYLLQTRNGDITDLGASSNIAIIENQEFWRPFTALFLHADGAHLFGNLASGMLFGTMLAKSIGALRAWILILLSGTIGNSITVLVTWPEPFSSIGASTAVFGALGILSGIGFSHMLKLKFKLPWARIAAPILGGLVILGWFGSGTPGDNTDVLGHLFGFCSGLLLGFFLGYRSIHTERGTKNEEPRHNFPS